ncbi:MAG: tetratricopeptide repeat protein [Pirellulales bacterium]|nr:tetratricopeptide repeat protein [Pirellulales bacterium]
MKSERRHELQHNELADWMVNFGTAVKPYANLILGAVLVLAIIGVGWTFMARRSHEESARAWEEFYSALANSSRVELYNVVEHYPGTEPAQWAQVVVGDLHLSEGCQELFTSRAGANEELNKARQAYDDALAATSLPAIRQRANFGLARAWEAQGKLDKAAEYYKKLTGAEGPYTLIAEARIKSLDKPSIKKFYDEFGKFDPKPAYQPGPTGPLQLDNLDNFGNLDLPGPDESLLPQEGTLDSPAKPDAAPADATKTPSPAPATDTDAPPVSNTPEGK